MMATVPHVTSGAGLRKFQADGFLLDRVYLPLYSQVRSCRCALGVYQTRYGHCSKNKMSAGGEN